MTNNDKTKGSGVVYKRTTNRKRKGIRRERNKIGDKRSIAFRSGLQSRRPGNGNDQKRDLEKIKQNGVTGRSPVDSYG